MFLFKTNDEFVEYNQNILLTFSGLLSHALDARKIQRSWRDSWNLD